MWFHINFRITCTTSVKYAIGVLGSVALNLSIALGSMDILMIFNENHFNYFLPIHEHISYNLFVFSISFFNFLYFSKYMYFTSLVKFIHRYFIFNASINGIVFLIYLSDSLLSVYRNATDF